MNENLKLQLGYLRAYALSWPSLDRTIQESVLPKIRAVAENLLADQVSPFNPGQLNFFLQEFARAVDQVLADNKDVEKAVIPPYLKELVKEHQNYIEREEEEQVARRVSAGDYRQKTLALFRRTRTGIGQTLADEGMPPPLADLTSLEITGDFIDKLPPSVRPVPVEEVQAVMSIAANEILKKQGLKPGPIVSKLAQEVLEKSRQIAKIPKHPPDPVPTSKPVVVQIPPAQLTPEDHSQGLRDKLALGLAGIGNLGNRQSAREGLAQDLSSVFRAYFDREYVKTGELTRGQAEKLLKKVLESPSGQDRFNRYGEAPKRDEVAVFVRTMIDKMELHANASALSNTSLLPRSVRQRMQEAQPRVIRKSLFQQALGIPWQAGRALVGMGIERHPDYPDFQECQLIAKGVTAETLGSRIEELLRDEIAPDDPEIVVLKELKTKLIPVEKDLTLADIRATENLLTQNRVDPADPRWQTLEQLRQNLETRTDLHLIDDAETRTGRVLQFNNRGQLDLRKTPSHPWVEIAEKAAEANPNIVYVPDIGFVPVGATPPKPGSPADYWQKFQISTRLWQPLEIAPGCREIRFMPFRRLIRLASNNRFESFGGIINYTYQRTIGRAVNYLANTSFGQRIIGFFGPALSGLSNRFIGWFGKTMGLKAIEWGVKTGLVAATDAAIVGAGAAAAPVSAGLSLVIAAALELGKKALKWIGHKINMLFAGLLNKDKPEKALALVAAGALLSVAAAPAGLIIGIPLMIAGGLALVSIGIAGLGVSLGGLGGGITAFFIALFTMPAQTVFIVWLVVVTLGATAVFTFYTVITTAGAFIVPDKPGALKGAGATFGTPIEPRPFIEAEHVAEIIILTLQQCGINYVNEQTWKETEECLSASSFNDPEMIAIFEDSVKRVGPGLQCVGFVRGVMRSLGHPLEGGRDAKEYLTDPPSDYSVSSEMSGVQVGDLVVMTGTLYGHIGIVVGQSEKPGYIKVAQAWGTSNGYVQITEVNQAYFDGFLRPE